MVRRLIVLSAVLLISSGVYSQTSLIPYASTWKYLDNGTDQGTAWRALNFNDATWKTGNGKFGYGIPDATTTVSYGTNANKKYITTYFRKAVTISDPAAFGAYTVKLKRDDGIVVYVNGVEVARNSMPTTAITYSTLATTASDNGTVVQTFTIPASAFFQGTNIISAEVHQSAASSTDMAFDLELTATLNTGTPPPSNDVLVNFNSSWKYLDNGSNQGTAWKSVGFNDASWGTGNGKFGYGIADATTNISYGASSTKKYVTTYFRKTISVSNPSSFPSLAGNIKRDDGVIVYINGQEVYRNNLTSGTISYSTLATEATDNGTTSQAFLINNPGLISGNNVVAVEIHQAKLNTPDMAFDLELRAAAPAVSSIKRQLPTTSPTNASSVTHRVIFSAPVTGVDRTDFNVTVLSGNVTSALAADAVVPVGTGGNTYDVTTSTIVGNGEIRLDLKSSGTGITNAAGVAISGGYNTGETYIINQSVPSVSAITRQVPLASITNLTSVVYRVLFSERVSGVDRSDFSISTLSGNVAGVLATNAVAPVGTSGTTYDVTISGIAGNGSIRLNLNPSGTGIVNQANTPIASGYSSGEVYTINQVAPSVASINRQLPLTEITNAGTVTLRVIFSELVTGVDRSDFAMTVLSGNVTGILPANAVVPVGPEGTTYDVTINSLAGNGTIRLDLNSSATGIINSIGTGIIGGFSSGQTYTINQTVPAVISIKRQTPATATTNAVSVTHRVIFSEAVTGVDRTDFTLTTVSGAVSGTIGTSAVAPVGTDGTTYDVTTTTISGNGVLRLDLNGSGTGITNAIGTAIATGFTSGETYTINQAAPAVVSINRQSPATATTNAVSVTHRVIFSEAVTGVDKNDFTLTIVSGTVSGTIGTSAVAVVGTDGTTYDVTTTAISGNGVLRLDLNASGTGITNTIGTAIAAGFSSGQTYTINQTAPAVISINRQSPATATTNAASVTHRVIFSEAVTGVDKNDFTLTIVSGTVSGTIGTSAVSAVGTDGTTYDVTTTSISGNGVLRLDLNASGTGIANSIGTAIASGFTSGQPYTINQTAPAVISINRQSPATATTNAASVTHRVIFSEAVTGVDKNDFTLTIVSGTVSGTLGTSAVAAVGTDGTTYDVTTTAISGNGVLRLDLNASATGITNTIGTAIAAGFTSGQTYTINQTAPAVISINRQSPATATTNAVSVTHRVTFSEAVTGVDKNDFTLTIVSGTVSGTLGTSAVAAVGTDGTTYDVTTTAISGNGILRLDLNASATGITNTIGTAIASGFTSGQTYTINQTAPAVISINRQSPATATTNAASVTHRVIFSEAVTGVDKNDFTLTIVSGTVSGTIGTSAVAAVGTDGTTYDVTTTSISGNGVLRLDLNASGTGITNSIGTAIASGFTSGQTYTINQTAPAVISINRQSPATATTNAASVTHRVIFSEAVTGVDKNDFTLTIVSGTVSGALGTSAVAAVGTDGTTYDVTTTAISGSGVLRLDLNASGTGITNSIGTAIASGYTSGETYTINQTAPAVISINRQSPATATTNAVSVTHRVIFSEAVTGVDKNDFTLTIVSGTVSGTIGTSAVSAVGADGTTYDVTTTAVSGTGVLRLDLNASGTGITNTIGTAITSGFTSGETYTINQTAPAVVSINRQSPATATTNAASVTHRVTFSEAVTGVDKNDFALTIVSGTVSGTLGTSAVAAVGTDGTTYDVTTTSIAGNGLLRLDLNASGTGITNTIGTTITSGFTSGETYTINQTAPAVISINRLSPASATTNAASVTHRVTFSESVTGVDKNDFTLTIVSGTVSGALGTSAVSAVGSDGTTYDVTTTAISGTGVLRLDLNASGTGITNTIGTAITSGFTSGETYTINQTAPAVISINRQSPATATTNAASVTHRVTFSEAVTGVDKNDFTLTIVSGTVSGALGTSAVDAVGTDGTTYDVTTMSISGNGVLRLDLNASGTGITNTIGTAIASGFTSGETYTINQTAPAVASINRQSPASATTNAASVTHRVIFSEAVTGVDNNDFTITIVSGTISGTLGTSAVAAVGTDGTTYDVTTTSISGTGVLRLDLNASGTGIANTIGTAIASGFTSGETYTINQTAPAVISINRQSPATATTSAASVTHRVIFSEAVTGVDKNDFTLTIVSGTVSGTLGTSAVAAVGTDGTTYDVTTTTISGNGVLRLDLNASGTGITNNIGTAITSGFTSGETYTINQIAPAVLSINRQNPATAATNAATVTHRVTFSEAVTGVDRTDFALTIVSGTVAGTLGTSAVAAVGSDGTTYDVTTSNITGNGVLRLDLKATGTGITNILGTAIASGFTTGQTYTISQPINLSLIQYKSTWKYLDNGSNQGTAWFAPSFDDNSWKSGAGLFGYGRGDEGTVLSFGPSSSAKYITTYFRKSVNIPDTSQFNGYTLNYRRDDGVVIYINGVELTRSNMPATGTITSSTLALSNVSDNGNGIQTVTLGLPQLKQGNNIIAVELHQYHASSSDVAFDLELKGKMASPPPAIVYGPYLNMATQNTITIRWRTDSICNSRVSYGTSPSDLSQVAIDPVLTKDHVVQLSGLQVNTQYYYSIGTIGYTLQGDQNNYFKTLPEVGSTQKVRVLVTGDMGLNSTAQTTVKNAYLNYNGTKYTDVWMLLGDNAYNNGLDLEYQNNFFTRYHNDLTKNHVIWPAPGNHDYANSGARQLDHAIPYYNVFTLPANGQAGGVPSNTEAYYSYNVGNIHFVSLDSYGWEAGNTRLYDTLGPQVTWLKQDLALNTQKWTVVYFHHPPYTKGSHNSDTENELINMRQRVVRILERYKVDLVLSGHSHAYERSMPINGHYGLETTFDTTTMALTTSSLRNDGTPNSCVYRKNSSDPRNGIVYAVVGSSAIIEGSTAGYPHNAMQYSNITNAGAMVIEIEDNKLEAKWICSDGVSRDQFTIIKDAGRTIDTTVNSGSQLVLTASWQGTYQWSTGETTRSITVNPVATTSYSVTDGSGCLTDVYNVTVNGASGLANNTRISSEKDELNIAGLNVRVAPNPSATQFTAQLQTSSTADVLLSVTDMFGRQVYTEKGTPKKTYSFGRSLSPGMYILRVQQGNKSKTVKIIKQQF